MRAIFAITCLFVSALSLAESNKEPIKVDSMVVGEEAGGDCGCYFYLQNLPEEKGFILYWAFEDKQAVMKLNGKLTNLKLTDGKLKDKLGQETSFKLKGSSITGKGTCRVSGVCPDDSESCEVTNYNGTLTLKNVSNEIIIPIRGGCGC